MKKRFLVLSMLLFSLMLAACGNQVTEVSQEAETTDVEEVVAEEVVENEADTLLEEGQKLLDEGKDYLYGTDGKEFDLQKARECFDNALECGINDANFYIGALYDWYSYPTQDLEKAVEHYKKNEENPSALVSLAFNYLYGQFVDKDEEKAIEYANKALEMGCVDANFFLATKASDDEDFDEALKLYDTVANESDEQLYLACALNDIGYRGYECGELGGVDYEKAMEYYEKAASLYNSDAIANIGTLYCHGYGVNQDYEKGIEWLEKAASMNNARAMRWLAMLYHSGEGIEIDDSKTLEWFMKAADLNDSSAMYNLGIMYYDGECVEQDYIKALEWYEKAAALNNADAMVELASMYKLGRGVEKDVTKSKEWFEKAADFDNVSAIFYLADICYDEKDFEKTVELLERGANLGHEASMTSLATLYYNGTVIAKDYSKAFEFYKMAADLGNADGMYGLGCLYYFGYGVSQDYSKALSWFEKSYSITNQASACEFIGASYWYGLHDLAKAIEWFKKGADAGDSHCKQQLIELQKIGVNTQ